MKKFVCEQNIAHFQKLLSETADAGLQRTLQALLSSAKRELAILNSTLSGADVLPFQDRRRRLVDAQAVKQQSIRIRQFTAPLHAFGPRSGLAYRRYQ
jgi:hypothetical protein